MDNVLGERIKELRKHYNWTQQDLAEKLGVTSASISSWESGTRRPDFETLDNLCDIFKVTLDYLLGRVDKNEYLMNRLENLKVDILEDEAEHYENLVNLFLALDFYGKEAVEEIVKAENKRCKEQGTLQDTSDFQVVIRSVKKRVSVK